MSATEDGTLLDRRDAAVREHTESENRHAFDVTVLSHPLTIGRAIVRKARAR
jgi:hypothetical protein